MKALEIEVLAPKYAAIPIELKKLDQWIVWEARARHKPGKPAKVPVHPSQGHSINPIDTNNHLTFERARKAHQSGVGSGLGIVLTGIPVTQTDSGQPLYLIGIDLDDVNKSEEAFEAARCIDIEVRSYMEFSPSGAGLRIFAYSTHKSRSGQSTHGEIYAEKRFLTVTGQNARRSVVDASSAIQAIEQRWWPSSHAPVRKIPLSKAALTVNQRLVGEPLQENKENIQRVESLLARVPPDSPYDIWRDCIWSVASLGWDCGRMLAEDWSRKSAAHWPNEGVGCEAQATLEGLFHSFDGERGITFGTLHHHAEDNDPTVRTGVGIENQAAGLPKGYFPQAGMTSSKHAPITTDPLTKIQQRFCLFKLGGDIWVGDYDQIDFTKAGGSSVLEMYKREPGKILIKRLLETLLVSVDKPKLILDFFNSPQTTVYNAVAFSPLPTPPDTLNLWSGSPVEPSEGDWQTIQMFLQEVVCNSDTILFSYLIRFMAHMLQKPEEKPGVMITLLGGQGTGKGTFFKLLSAIWPNTTLQVADVNHVVSNFNAAIERNYVLCMDEAFFAGDKKNMDRLKSLITEPVITIEQKYQPRRTIESFHRYFAASNHDHFAQVDIDDRRFAFFEVSEKRKGDFEYWEQVYAAISTPSMIAAMVHSLMSTNLDHYNVRRRPNTKAHMDQKIRSLNGFDRYWFEVLHTEEFMQEDTLLISTKWSKPFFLSTEEMFGGWRKYERGQRQFAPRQERDLHSALKKLCPSASKTRHAGHGNQKRGYKLPALPVARADFEKVMGGKVQWDD